MRFVRIDLNSSTPARANRDTGDVYINPPVFDKLPSSYQKFILKHEAGHIELQTTNEMLADRYAFERYAGTEPGSLKSSVEVIHNVLHFDKPEDKKRLMQVILMALHYDATVYKNKKAEQMLNQLLNSFNGKKTMTPKKENSVVANVDGRFLGENPISNFSSSDAGSAIGSALPIPGGGIIGGIAGKIGGNITSIFGNHKEFADQIVEADYQKRKSNVADANDAMGKHKKYYGTGYKNIPAYVLATYYYIATAQQLNHTDWAQAAWQEMKSYYDNASADRKKIFDERGYGDIKSYMEGNTNATFTNTTSKSSQTFTAPQSSTPMASQGTNAKTLDQSQQNNANASGGKTNWLLYGGIALGVIILAVVIFLIVKR